MYVGLGHDTHRYYGNKQKLPEHGAIINRPICWITITIFVLAKEGININNVFTLFRDRINILILLCTLHEYFIFNGKT